MFFLRASGVGVALWSLLLQDVGTVRPPAVAAKYGMDLGELRQSLDVQDGGGHCFRQMYSTATEVRMQKVWRKYLFLGVGGSLSVGFRGAYAPRPPTAILVRVLGAKRKNITTNRRHDGAINESSLTQAK